MERDLRTIERRVEANEADVQLAKRFDSALARAGRLDDVRARYRFKYLCPLAFAELSETESPLVRDCGACERSVYYCRDRGELDAHVAAGDCVSFHREALGDALLGLAESTTTHSAREATRPCLLAGPEFVDLDAPESVDEESIQQLPFLFADTYRVFPVRVDPDGALVVAVSSLDAGKHDVSTPVTDLRFMLNREIRVALALPGAIGRAIERHYPEPAGADANHGFMGMLIE